MIALYPSLTVKKPDPRNSTTSRTMMIWMIKKLLRNASARACVPGSSAPGNSGARELAGGFNWLGSWSLILA
jgi:hypothetical protein